MRKRDELADPNSCLNRARDDEWLFVLLGRDVAAAVAVRAWIESRIRQQKNKRHDPQIREAAAWIDAVVAEQWSKLTPAQKKLKKAHGTPEEFANACNQAADRLYITTLECEAGIVKYYREWAEAGAAQTKRRKVIRQR